MLRHARVPRDAGRGDTGLEIHLVEKLPGEHVGAGSRKVRGDAVVAQPPLHEARGDGIGPEVRSALQRAAVAPDEVVVRDAPLEVRLVDYRVGVVQRELDADAARGCPLEQAIDLSIFR